MIFTEKLTIYYYKRCSVGVKQTHHSRYLSRWLESQYSSDWRNHKKRYQLCSSRCQESRYSSDRYSHGMYYPLCSSLRLGSWYPSDNDNRKTPSFLCASLRPESRYSSDDDSQKTPSFLCASLQSESRYLSDWRNHETRNHLCSSLRSGSRYPSDWCNHKTRYRLYSSRCFRSRFSSDRHSHGTHHSLYMLRFPGSRYSLGDHGQRTLLWSLLQANHYKATELQRPCASPSRFQRRCNTFRHCSRYMPDRWLPLNCTSHRTRYRRRSHICDQQTRYLWCRFWRRTLCSGAIVHLFAYRLPRYLPSTLLNICDRALEFRCPYIRLRSCTCAVYSRPPYTLP